MLSGLHGEHYPLSPAISSFLCEVDERQCEMVAPTHVGSDPTLTDPSFTSLSQSNFLFVCFLRQGVFL